MRADRDDLERRIGALEALEEIKKVMRHYVNCLIQVRWDDVVDCFTENARVEIGISGTHQGRIAIARLFKEDIGSRHIGKEMIFLAHPLISVDGDRAAGSWLLYHMFTEATHIGTHAWVQGIYQCEYRKAGGRWKISDLKWKQRLGPRSVKLMEKYGVIDE